MCVCYVGSLTVWFLGQVYGPETSQLDLFDGTVKDLVRNVLEGGNSLVFTYGVTNAGKTFTFLGLSITPSPHGTLQTTRAALTRSSQPAIIRFHAKAKPL